MIPGSDYNNALPASTASRSGTTCGPRAYALAHPDEPQRTLEPAFGEASPGPGGGAVAVSVPDSSRAIATVLAFFAAAMVALLAIYLALTIPGAWFGAARTKHFDAKSLAVVAGRGSLEGETLTIAPADASGAVIVTVNATLSARDYPGIAWHVAGLPDGTDARLLWRSEFRPGRTFNLPIPTEGDRLAPVVASRDPNWIGPINGIALALRLPAAESVRMAGVSADPLTLTTQLAGRIRDWTTLETWTGASINAVAGGADLQELPLPALLGLAAAFAVVAALAIAIWRPHWIGAGLPLALVFMFACAWFVLDARWQWNLARQLAVTAEAYAGKDWRAKHVAAEDGALFEFIETVRAKFSTTPARVFMIAEVPYFRGRGAYHLYPHNVYSDLRRNAIPAASAMRPGDYLVVYRRRGVQYDAAQGMLRWDGGPPVAAEPLVVLPGAAAFRIR